MHALCGHRVSLLQIPTQDVLGSTTLRPACLMYELLETTNTSQDQHQDIFFQPLPCMVLQSVYTPCTHACTSLRPQPDMDNCS